MIGVAPNAPTIQPWTPHAAPQRRTTRITAGATPIRRQYRNAIAPTAAVRPSDNENTKPPIMMSVIPSATTPTNAPEVEIACRLSAVAKPDVVAVPHTTTATKIARITTALSGGRG